MLNAISIIPNTVKNNEGRPQRSLTTFLELGKRESHEYGYVPADGQTKVSQKSGKDFFFFLEL